MKDLMEVLVKGSGRTALCRGRSTFRTALCLAGHAASQQAKDLRIQFSVAGREVHSGDGGKTSLDIRLGVLSIPPCWIGKIWIRIGFPYHKFAVTRVTVI